MKLSSISIPTSFEPAILVAINAIVIVVVELAGNGLLFFQTKAVNILELLFVLLAITRIFSKYGITDPVLRRFLRGSMLAMIMLAAAPVVQLAAGPIMRLSESTVLLNTVNLYIVSFLVIIISVEGFLASYAKRSPLTVWLPVIIFLLFVGISSYNVATDASFPLDATSPLPGLYVASFLTIAALGFEHLLQVIRVMPFLKLFVYHLIVGTMLIAASAVPYIMIQVIQSSRAWPLHQIVYAGHFMAYAALSVMFLGFGHLTQLGGVYQDIKEAEVEANK